MDMQDGQRIEFFLPMARVPTVTHQQKRTKGIMASTGNDGKGGKVKVVHYEDERLKEARSKFMGLLAGSGKVPDVKIEGVPVRFVVKWLFPISESMRKKGVRHGDYKITKPDTDNLQKLFKDCCTDVGFWKDDALVAEEYSGKYWADPGKSGVYVCIETL